MQSFSYSVENIYSQVGQYDLYAGFEFRYGSDAYNTYGRAVHGFVIYTPSERAILEEAIQPGNDTNNDGTVLIDSGSESKELNLQLKSLGFKASDILTLRASTSRGKSKVFKTEGIKEIPNTITLSFNPSWSDPYTMEFRNLERRLERNLPLLQNEERKYYLLRHLTRPEKTPFDDIRKHLINPSTSKFYDDVIITWGSFLYNVVGLKNIVVVSSLERAFESRKKDRLGYIYRHLGISYKILDRFESSDPTSWNQLMKVVIGFEPTMIAIWGWQHPVYWDFERFIHIYLRHYKDFFLEGSSKGQGTNFRYHYDDIRRVIRLIIEANKEEIEAKLRDGKPYSKYEEQGYYFNGNYYTFRIDNTGKLMQFYPHQ